MACKPYQYKFKVAIAILLVVSLLYFVGVNNIVSVVHRADLGLLLLGFPLVFVALVLSGFSLWLLLKKPTSGLGVFVYARAYIVTTFVSLWLPGRMGDFSMAYFLRDSLPVSECVAVILVDKLLSVTALTLFSVVAAFYFMSPQFGVAVLLLVTVSFGGCFYVIMRRNLAAFIVKKVHRRIKRKVLLLVRSVHFALSSENASILLANVAIKVIRVLVVGVLMMVMVASFQESISFVVSILGASAVQLMALVPISIQGVGVQEYSYVYVFGSAGASASAVVMASVASRVVSIGVVGALYLAESMIGRYSMPLLK